MSLELIEPELIARGRAMASDITIRACAPDDDNVVRKGLDAALDTFTVVERACTRFDPSSPLMLANARSEGWRRVGRVCFKAIEEAHRAYTASAGRFDPRVLEDLLVLGYDHSLPFSGGQVTLPGTDRAGRVALPPWRPRFRAASHEVILGRHPVDLGGIGKGLAVRWASQALRVVARHHLIEAGGDCYCAGSAPDGEPWRVAVEDPSGSSEPLAVLALRDRACATSSIRLRRWRAGARHVHHILDPRTGRPGGEGLAAVTVVGSDPADAEVWSKALFLEGSRGIDAFARRKGLAALWVELTGEVGLSAAMRPHMLWRRR